MKTNYFAGLVLAGLFAAPCVGSAADMHVAKPASHARAFNWSGFYAGLHAGYAWNEIDGWFAGGQIGFNAQAAGSPFVWGIELDSAFANIGDSASVPGITASTDADYIGSLRARAGLSSERTLLYVTGGLAWAHNEISATALGVTVSDSKTHTGWTVGAGIEQDFGGGWSAKVEYLYVDLGSKTYFGFLPSGNVDVHTVRFGLNYRFGH